MVQHQNIELLQIGVQAGFVSAAPAHPTVGAVRLLWRYGSVGETDDVGACGTEATGQGCAKGSSRPCDADPFAMKGGLGHGASLGHPWSDWTSAKPQLCQMLPNRFCSLPIAMVSIVTRISPEPCRSWAVANCRGGVQ